MENDKEQPALAFGNHKSDLLKIGVFLCALSLFSFTYLPGFNTPALMEEICDNAIDDDMDGLIDLNDPDCDCEVIEPVSLIPNPSFEDLNCCPNDISQLDCAETWIQASEPTTDLIHTCGWFGWNDFPPPTPFPDGEGIMGFRDGRVRQSAGLEGAWKEYAGACLITPLEADSSYRFEFDVGFVSRLQSPPINITFFGTPDCSNLPFGVGNEDLGCPTNGPGWVKLGSTLVSGDDGNKWVKGVIEVIPTEDIAAIAIGPDCPWVQTDVSLYYFFDNLLLLGLGFFELNIVEVSDPCQEDFRLRVPEDEDFSYQWFKDGIALIGETFSQLTKMYGDGNYQVMIDDGESCRISVGYEHIAPTFEETLSETICQEDTYLFGDQLLSESGFYIDTVRTADNCVKVVSLNLNVLGAIADTVSVQIFEGESYTIDKQSFREEGDHLITLTSAGGCDSLVFLQLDHFNVFFPNVFTPNSDGINDFFKIYSAPGLIENVELTIFDRWGAVVSRGDRWDGKIKEEPAGAGVYIYVANVRVSNGAEQQFSGAVTLIR